MAVDIEPKVGSIVLYGTIQWTESHVDHHEPLISEVYIYGIRGIMQL